MNDSKWNDTSKTVVGNQMQNRKNLIDLMQSRNVQSRLAVQDYFECV